MAITGPCTNHSRKRYVLSSGCGQHNHPTGTVPTRKARPRLLTVASHPLSRGASSGTKCRITMTQFVSLSFEPANRGILKTILNRTKIISDFTIKCVHK
ncbi:hypothetical protein AVEN_118394-1 [Araneus ventricosus]|uniref:Uncharacterized protein n=1 Tax=Araneus ventricosus TaxID=182803 RepID=A0A4Y2B566_ARAVE|nr:hypothetical protein AVEN_118394-1 [Araneus ventricosus]